MARARAESERAWKRVRAVSLIKRPGGAVLLEPHPTLASQGEGALRFRVQQRDDVSSDGRDVGGEEKGDAAACWVALHQLRGAVVFRQRTDHLFRVPDPDPVAGTMQRACGVSTRKLMLRERPHSPAAAGAMGSSRRA